jgi:hypothetical protein
VLGEEPFAEGNPTSRLSAYKGSSTARMKASRSVQKWTIGGLKVTGFVGPIVMNHTYGYRCRDLIYDRGRPRGQSGKNAKQYAADQRR